MTRLERGIEMYGILKDNMLKLFALSSTLLVASKPRQPSKVRQLRSTFIFEYIFQLHGGLRQMKSLLARACVVNWLTIRKINYVLVNCCQRRFKFKMFRLHTLY